jgi:hypothetical protein
MNPCNAIHEATHPSARLERRPRPPAEQPRDGGGGPAVVEDLLEALDAEADEDDGAEDE